MLQKERLDTLLTQRGLCASKEQAQRCILAGEVWLGANRLEKPGAKFQLDLPIELRSRAPRYVSRGGFKLEHALQKFQVCVKDRLCLDVGASTGGFTDCLLQHGARRVFAVDVGHGQLDQKLRNQTQVTVLEKVNARYLTLATLAAAHQDASAIDFVCMDASFISLKTLVPAVKIAAANAKDWVLLFKPQFEVGPENLGKGGVVRNPEATTQSLSAFDSFMIAHGFMRKNQPELCPLSGKKSGNTEILLHYVYN